MSTTRLDVIIGTARPNFLVLTPVCVLVGVASVTGSVQDPMAYAWPVVALLGALLAHGSVNMLNEYEDFRTGLDFRTERTPFSGGSGTLVQYRDGAGHALAGGILALLGTLSLGALLVVFRGPGLLPLGLVGIALVAVYSNHIVRSPLGSLLAPGLAFGPLMVAGTAYVTLGEYASSALVASLIPFFLVNGLLLLNQFPDVAADRSVGRRNLPIVLGRRTSSLVYGALVLGAYVTIVAAITAGRFPATAAVALVPGLAAPVLAWRVYRHADEMDRLIPLLGWNVVLTILTPLLLAIGLLLG